MGVILHEIAHAIGLYHEQSRPDRNSFVQINFDQIQSGKEGNFEIHDNIDSLNVPYDYRSIMHYGKSVSVIP